MFAMIPTDGGSPPMSGPPPIELQIWVLWVIAGACAVAMVYSVTVLAVMRVRNLLARRAVAPTNGLVTHAIGSAIGMVVATSSALILTTVAGQ
ncbi:hypothetical protein [Rhodococcus koreensis]|uniref:Uncharacterized protein n=1 Tax=Rhodococcus koreensis TaxID=99653 RepID=A0A1H4I5R6_9NOCA|nr:hypothetical protein [Rhodococcus koreensis]SEB29235.1 hypothetical protein SAMN04490239_0050 [Rhodococcus koreensis]